MKIFLHLSLWFLAFFKFIIEEFFNFPPSVVRVGIPLIILILLADVICKGDKKILFPFKNIFMLVSFLIVFSGFLNDISLFYISYFITYVIFPYLYLIIIVNERDNSLLKTITTTVLALFVIQIPASIIKFIFIGQGEKYVGTMSALAGSLTTVLCMVAVSYLFAKYLYTGNRRLFLYILLFVFFAIIGEKRVILLYVPFIMLLEYIYYFILHRRDIQKILRDLFVFITIGFTLSYTTVRLNPTLNPEGKIGGSFDLQYVVRYIIDYGKFDEEIFNASQKTELSRPAAFFFFIKYLSKKPAMTFLFGEGAGKLLYTGSNTVKKPMLYYYGVRYGGRMGFIWVYLQIGMVGVLLFSLLLIRMLLFAMKNIKHHRNKNYHYLAFIGIWASVMLDFLTYSISSITIFAIFGSFYLYFGLLYRDVRYKNSILLH